MKKVKKTAQEGRGFLVAVRHHHVFDFAWKRHVEQTFFLHFARIAFTTVVVTSVVWANFHLTVFGGLDSLGVCFVCFGTHNIIR